MNLELLKKFFYSHRGELTGALIGGGGAIAILLIGIFNTLFIGVCTAVGYYIGKRLSNDKDYIKKLLDKVLPPGTYR